MTEKVSMRTESGTCNVCAAPCSSCRHFNQAVSCMEVKSENEFSDEVSRVNAASRCSFNEASVMPFLKKRACVDRQSAASETSNLLSASSSHDSISENAESKASLRTFDTSDDVEMPSKVLLGGSVAHDQLLSKPRSVTGKSANISSNCDIASDAGVRTTPSLYDGQNVLCNGDNVSCVSGANDANLPVRDINVDIDRKNVSRSTTSVSSFFPGGSENACHVKSDPDCFSGFFYEREDNCNTSRRESMLSKESIQKDRPIGSANEDILQKSDPLEVPSSNCCAENSAKNELASYSNSQSGKSRSCNADSNDFEKKICSHHQVEPSECSAEHVESSLAKLETSKGAQNLGTHKNDNVPKLENSKSSLSGSSSSGTSMKIYPSFEAGIGADTAELPAESLNHLDLNEKIEKSSGLSEAPNILDPPLQSQPVDESDGSDIVEDDVKVCDICGDAGREDLLAICSRCSDGAEHTYCMRIMMDKVPEGDWLCEECQLKEEAENQKKDDCETVSGNPKVPCPSEKSENSAGPLNSKISLKSDTKLPDEEANRAIKVLRSPRVSSKRHSDNLEVPSAAKRQALETSAGSQKPLIPSKTNALSRESSFKNLDKGQVKPIHPIPTLGGFSSKDTAHTPPISLHNSSKIQPRLQSPRGTLLKSSSFNTLNSKPKVKLVHDDAPQKHKQGRHLGRSDSRKDGLVKTISKSFSFKTGSSHSSSTESKAKEHSSNISCAEESRGTKLAKERNLIERKNSFRSDRMVGSNVFSPKAEPKGMSRGETMPLVSSPTKYRDLKAVQTDGKLNTSSKLSSVLAQRGSEALNALTGRADVKRQSSFGSRGIGYPSLNGNSAEKKQTQVSPKDEVTANSTVDGPRNISDVVLQDGLPQSRESTTQDRKGWEPSFSQSRQSVPAGARNIRCQKCKEIGHAAQFCPNSSIRVSVLEATSARSSREVMNRSTKSKHANEAGFVQRSGIIKKDGLADQSDELSMSSTELSCEMASKNQPSSNCLRNLTSSDGAYDRQESFRNSTADSSRSITNVKVPALQLTGAVCTPKEIDLNAILPSDGNKLKPSLSDMQNLDSSVSIPLRVLSIPEHDYIWQGGFEVQRSGTLLDFCDGIQAHLSTSASPKVLEVVNKLPNKILLEEVSRSSTWPTQFQNCATEDNIALYFFASDVESYVRSYQSLLENMMKNDMALKGILDGIELLIFPSNQLPANSQRWNMLFFLWGVFRGKRANCSEKIDVSQKNFSKANSSVVPLEVELRTPVMALSLKECFSGNMGEDLTTCARSLNRQESRKYTAPMQFHSPSSSGLVDMNCYKEESSSDQKCLRSETKSSPGNDAFDSNSLLRIRTSNVQLRAKMKGNGTSMLEHGDPESKEELELGQCSQATGDSNIKCNTVPMILDNSNHRQADFPSTSSERQETSSSSHEVFPVGASSLAQDASLERSRMGERVEERMKDHSRSEMIHQEKIKAEGKVDAKIVLENDLLRSDLVEYEQGTCLVNSNRKRPYSTLLEMVPQASGESSACTSQLMPWQAMAYGMVVDGESESKKMKRLSSERYPSSSRDHNSLTDRSSSQMLNLGSRFLIEEQRMDGAYDGTIVPASLMTTERYFFPVDLGPIKDIRPKGNNIPVQILSSDDEDQMETEPPDLELALGGEKRSPKQGILPLFCKLAERKNNHGKCPEIVRDNKDDNSLDSLSLSLAVPFSDKVQIVKPVAKPEPERSRIDTSLFLFGGFPGT